MLWLPSGQLKKRACGLLWAPPSNLPSTLLLQRALFACDSSSNPLLRKKVILTEHAVHFRWGLCEQAAFCKQRADAQQDTRGLWHVSGEPACWSLPPSTAGSQLEFSVLGRHTRKPGIEAIFSGAEKWNAAVERESPGQSYKCYSCYS